MFLIALDYGKWILIQQFLNIGLLLDKNRFFAELSDQIFYFCTQFLHTILALKV